MAAKNKAVEPEETVVHDNHATETAQDNRATETAQDNRATVVAQAERNPLCSSVRIAVIPVVISRGLKDRTPKSWLSAVSRYGRRMPNAR